MKKRLPEWRLEENKNKDQEEKETVKNYKNISPTLK